MGEILDSDWSRQNLLRSDWLGLIGASYTTEEETLTVFNKRVLNMFKLWTVQCA